MGNISDYRIGNFALYMGELQKLNQCGKNRPEYIRPLALNEDNLKMIGQKPFMMGVGFRTYWIDVTQDDGLKLHFKDIKEIPRRTELTTIWDGDIIENPTSIHALQNLLTDLEIESINLVDAI